MKRQKSLLLPLICCAIFLQTCKAPEALRDKAKAQRFLSKIERLDPSALSYSTDSTFEYMLFKHRWAWNSRSYNATFNSSDSISIFDSVTQTSATVIFNNGVGRLTLDIPAGSHEAVDSALVTTAINHSIEVEKKPWYGVLLSLWRTSKWLVILAVVALLALFLWKRV